MSKRLDESLGNCYYWNRWYRKSGEDKRLKLHCPKEWALPIMGEEEFRELTRLSGASTAHSLSAISG